MPTYDFYTQEYGGDLITQTDWNTYAKRAYLVLNIYCGMTLDTAPSQFTEAINYAVCFQADFLMLNGIEITTEGMSEGGFTVGKVRIDGKSNSETSGQWNTLIAPLALQILAQSGLASRHIHTAIEPFAPYPWRW